MTVAQLPVAGAFRNRVQLAPNGPRRETCHCRDQPDGSGECPESRDTATPGTPARGGPRRRAAGHGNTRGSKSGSLTMLALLPVARMTKSPRRSACLVTELSLLR